MKTQSGFTLIELVVVIVILGILAATAIPAFVDLSTEAEQAATDGVAGALGGGAAINYAACSAGSASCVVVDNCTDVATTLQGGLPAGYTITAGAVADNVTVACTLDGPGAAAATFNAIGT